MESLEIDIMIPPLADLPDPRPDLAPLRALHLADQNTLIADLLPALRLAEADRQAIAAECQSLVEAARAARPALFEQFLHSWRLNSREGRLLLTMAEALLRIPDADNANDLIHDLLTRGDWSLPDDDAPALIQVAARGLSLSARWLEQDESLPDAWHGLRRRLGDPLFRRALVQGVQLIARQFVLGETLPQALRRRDPSLRYSFDMLGEAAQSDAEAEHYHRQYRQAIEVLAGQDPSLPVLARDGISIKLSALHPRFEFAQWAIVREQLWPRLQDLVSRAATTGIPVTLDAEEADRLEIALRLFGQALTLPEVADWQGLGVAVQAYQKRAPAVIDWLADQAREHNLKLPVRLVKGAYWDTEIKLAQQQSLCDYPVHTRKVHTDISYLACAKRLLSEPTCFYPQFATHNCHTLAWLHHHLDGFSGDVEFQRLAGMGEAQHRVFVERHGYPLRLYAPVGPFSTLLPYLVRRLMENGSSQSFVNLLLDEHIAAEQLAVDPTLNWRPAREQPQELLPPPERFAPRRVPTLPSLTDPDVLHSLRQSLHQWHDHRWRAGASNDHPRPRHSPADGRELGEVFLADVDTVHQAYAQAREAFVDWSHRPVSERADIVRRFAGLLEQHQPELLYLLMLEGGKTFADAFADWREAHDFCGYYAQQAETLQGTPLVLEHVSGEANQLTWHARGVFLCISPWNFPLAIFCGQVLAALVSGNTVLAKPASDTPFIAWRAVQLLHEAGVPEAALHFIGGEASQISDALLNDSALAGVAVTGSTATAKHIERTLAARDGPLLPLIAETGGLNVLIADSSALPEQLVRDVLTSACTSAGQRCSALRVLLVEDTLLDRLLPKLEGAMASLKMGHPALLASDVGPVINAGARDQLEQARAELRRHARWSTVTPEVDPALGEQGFYVAPEAALVEWEHLPEEEIFGPLLYIAAWRHDERDKVIDYIERTGYGLTLGIHSRIQAHIDDWVERVRVGNLYINRNQIGAVPGCQPFGGERLSGTGFKAGGPHYLMRFCTERVITDNRSALGIDPELVNLGDGP